MDRLSYYPISFDSRPFHPMSFDPKSFDPKSFDLKSFDPMSVNPFKRFHTNLRSIMYILFQNCMHDKFAFITSCKIFTLSKETNKTNFYNIS